MPNNVPENLDTTRFENIEPLFRELLARPVASAAETDRWLLDVSELAATVGEGRTRLYIAMTCNTDDTAAQNAYSNYIEQVAPKLTPLCFELDKRLVALDAEHHLDTDRYGVLVRSARADAELFRAENVPLQTQLSQLSQKYDQITGAMTVVFEGEERTLPQMGRFQEVTDRATREQAWRVVANRRDQNREEVHAIYDEMVGLRHKVAVNAGFRDYVGYAYKEKHRFDYGVEACTAFHDGIEKAFVPLMRSIDAERAKLLGVPKLRPWDMGVDARSRPPLRPFDGGADLMAKSLTAIRGLDPGLAAMFQTLGDGRGRVTSAADVGREKLDLDSRKGKAPGGYQEMLERSRVPFIFMNAAGLHKDMVTMVHEAGHAFHSMLCVDEPLVQYRSSPIEFAEVASMSMEMLTMDHWGAFYPDPADLARARREQLKRVVIILPWVATIDAFQHWVYANPGHSRKQREEAWLALDERFGSKLDWSGIEHYRGTTWHRQMHLFSVPFYYVEYGIAQLGALQLWLHALESGPASAIARYRAGLSLGGSKPLPALFEASGLKFDFGPMTVGRLADQIATELAKTPE